MKRILNLTIVLSLLAGASLFSCADSESRSSLVGDATVIINLGLPPDNETARLSIIDRVLRFFSSEAVAAPAPAAFSTINIRVTGDGIGSIAKDFPSSEGVISMTVPGGGVRTFDVTAQVAPGDPSAALTFHGTTVANVPGGETVNVPVLMTVDETKLVIPDYYNNRIVKMDNLNGSNTVIRTSIEIFAGIYTLYPYDIDFDARGRIYIANNTTGASGGVFTMENIFSILGSGCIRLLNNTNGVRSIAIDRKRSKLYYVDLSNDLYSLDLNLEAGTPVMILASNAGTGLAIGTVCVDEATGILYLSYVSGTLTSVPHISRFDPDNLTWVNPVYNPGTAAFDVTVKGGYLYAAFFGLGQVRRLPLNLNTVANPPVILTNKPDDSDAFIGPSKFIAITNRKFFIIDDSQWFDPDDRVVSFDDIDGSGWATTATPGTFKFYYTC